MLLMKLLKNRLIIILGFILVGVSLSSIAQNSSPGRQSNISNPQLIAKLNKTIPQLLDSANIPGLAISVIKDGQIIYTQVYGVKNAETKEKMAINTVFEAASLSKPVFAYVCLQLV